MARTYANDPLQMYQFRVSMPGLPAGMGFQKVSGLTKEVGVVEYDEGGYSHTHKLPGKEKTPEITLEKGMFANADLESVYKRTLQNPDFRTTVIIEHLDKFGKVSRSWTLAEAWVSKWEGSEYDATSEDVAIEKITIQFEHYL
jgi:phage tail-like protein